VDVNTSVNTHVAVLPNATKTFTATLTVSKTDIGTATPTPSAIPIAGADTATSTGTGYGLNAWVTHATGDLRIPSLTTSYFPIWNGATFENSRLSQSGYIINDVTLAASGSTRHLTYANQLAGNFVTYGHSKSNTETLSPTSNNTEVVAMDFDLVNSSSAWATAAVLRVYQAGAGGATYVPGAFEFLVASSSGAAVQRLVLASSGSTLTGHATEDLAKNSVSCSGKTKVNATDGQITSCTDATATDVGASKVSTAEGANTSSTKTTDGAGTWLTVASASINPASSATIVATASASVTAGYDDTECYIRTTIDGSGAFGNPYVRGVANYTVFTPYAKVARTTGVSGSHTVDLQLKDSAVTGHTCSIMQSDGIIVVQVINE
jgi:hypothetical protein